MKTTTTNIATAVVATAKKVAVKAGAVVQVAVELFYLEVAGVLYSIKPKDYAVLQKTPTAATLAKYFASNVLKHNPTCVFNSPTGRKSFEARRPMVYLQGGKLIQQVLAVEPAKVEKQTSGGKVIKVAQTGPGTIYVRTSATDKRPYSLKPDQFENLKKDMAAIKYMGLLKHLPTCVEISLTHGLISTDANRPMYEMKGKQLVQIHAPGMEPKVEKVKAAPKGAAKPTTEGDAETAAPKAKSVGKKNKAEREAAKAEAAAPVVEAIIEVIAE